MTPIDRALQSRNAFLGFAGIITAVAAWNIWGGEIFPPASKDDKTKHDITDPTAYSKEKLRRWLQDKGIEPREKASREELLNEVQRIMKFANQ